MVLIGVLALAGYGQWWPFDESLRPAGSYDEPSIWQFLLSDSTTLGFVRLGIIALALFVIASVPALVVAGRWLKGLGAGGISADDAASARHSLEELQRQVRTLAADIGRVRRERDRAREIARRSLETIAKMDEGLARMEANLEGYESRKADRREEDAGEERS